MRRSRGILPVLLLALLAGCISTEPKRLKYAGRPAEVAEAERVFLEGDYTGAMIMCIDLARRDPIMPGLAELQTRTSEVGHQGPDIRATLVGRAAGELGDIAFDPRSREGATQGCAQVCRARVTRHPATDHGCGDVGHVVGVRRDVGDRVFGRLTAGALPAHPLP